MVTWQINGHWQFDPGPERQARSRCDSSPRARSRPLSPSNIVTSTGLVEGKALAQTIVEGGGGWSSVLEAFASTAEAQG